MNDNNQLNNNQSLQNNNSELTNNNQPLPNNGPVNQNTLSDLVNQSPLNQNIPTRSEYQQINNPEQIMINQPQNINNQPVNPIPSVDPMTEPRNGTSNIGQLNQGFNTTLPNQNQEMMTPNGTLPQTPKINPEIEDTFVEPKKKPIAAIISIILLVIVVGGGLIYYFVLDNPQKIFQTITNKVLDSVVIDKQNYDKYNLNYQIDFDLTTTNKEYQELYSLLSNFNFEGTIGYDKKQNSSSIIINSTYQNKNLPSIHMLTNDNLIYLSLKEIYPKTIKMDYSSEPYEDSVSLDVSDYQKLYNSFAKNLKETLKTAKYNKKYTKLNNQNVKKISLTINKSLVETLITKLLNDQEFMTTYTKITSTSEEELSNNLNETLSELDDSTEIISIYLGILNNEFIMFEDDAGEDYQVKVNKTNNTYHFEYSENYTLMYQGNIEITNKDQNKISLSIDLLEEKTTLKLNYTYKLDSTKGIDELDITNSIAIEEITEEETLDIMTKLFENEAISTIIKDTGLDSYLNNSDNPEI